jgi:anti-sigma B factor antagonist
MDVITSQFQNYDLIKATGRVDSFTAPKLAEVLHNFTKAGRYNLAFDMSEIDYISSAGLRVMIDIQKNCRQANRGELLLIGVPKRITETLELAGFIPLFRLFDTVDTAIKNF